MRTKFHQNLDGLKERLLVMAGLAEQAIQRSIEAFRTRDTSFCDLVFQSEPAINRMEREVDEMAYELLATEQPMAVDLRFILAVIRINSDIERVGDQAVNIAAHVVELGPQEETISSVDIPKIAELAQAMVRKSLQSFIEGDAEMARSVLEMDDEVDTLNNLAFRTLTDIIPKHPERTADALNALVIARNLERVGDHATNIAEDVIFWVQGADVRHSGPPRRAVTRGTSSSSSR